MSSNADSVISPLASRRCTPKATPITPAQVQQWIQEIPQWTIDAGVLARVFNFKNFYQTMAFANAVAWIANTEDHHPDLVISYNRCNVNYTTHSVGGLSENDFICAAKIDVIPVLSSNKS